MQRNPASGVIALMCVAVLLIVLGVAIATQPTDHYPSSPTNTEETNQ